MFKSVLLLIFGTGVICYRNTGHVAPSPYTSLQPNTPSPNSWRYPSAPSHAYHASFSEHWNFQSGSHWQDNAPEPSPSQTYEPSQTNQHGTYISSNISPVASLKPIETRETGQTDTTYQSTVGHVAKTELSVQNHTYASQTPRNQTQFDRPTSTQAPFKYTTSRLSANSQPVPPLKQFMAPSLQYHVGIYTKTSTPYEQICGGSLVKDNIVISAAHCFWSDDKGIGEATSFAVAAGKLMRAWDAIEEVYAQYSDITEIKVPPRFRGAATSFQDDIAILRLATPFKYAPGVKPLCVDFNLTLERNQLENGNEGTVAGWGLTMRNGEPSERLNFVKLPFVTIDSCLLNANTDFLKYITSDKICAGSWRTGRALCRGDSGGGLIYTTNSVPYLQGIASTAPRDNNQCNVDVIATFTYMRAHITFLTDHVPDITEECRRIYGTDNATLSLVTGKNKIETPSDADLNVLSKTQNLKMTKNDGTSAFNVTVNVKNGRLMLDLQSVSVKGDRSVMFQCFLV